MSNNNYYKKKEQLRLLRLGGANRVRTDDLRLARAALSQLSYSPQSRKLQWA